MKSSVAIGLAISIVIFGAQSIAPFAGPTEVQDNDPPRSKVSEETTIGISETKPRHEPFVLLPDRTYMVPYTTTIPGTEVKYTMVPIPGGKFKMGSPGAEQKRHADEGPQFEVQVKPFWIGQCEVTWAEFDTFKDLNYMLRRLQQKQKRWVVNEDTKIDAVSGPSMLYDPKFVYQYGEGANQPAAMMTQFSAKQYTKFLSLLSNSFYRLPTEAEWEYACRGGSQTAYHFGDDPHKLSDYGWFDENSKEQRHPVGQKKPNRWQLYDMHGNVAEWTLDQYSKDRYAGLSEASNLRFPLTIQAAFLAPTKRFPLVVRGGSYSSNANDCRSASRLASQSSGWKKEDPDFPNSPWWFTEEEASGVGFRILRPLNEPDSRAEKEAFWAPAHPSLFEDAQLRWENDGRGFYGVVNASLADEIKKLLEERQK